MCLTSSIRRLLYVLRHVNAPVDLCSHLQIDGARPIAHPHFDRVTGGRHLRNDNDNDDDDDDDNDDKFI